MAHSIVILCLYASLSSAYTTFEATCTSSNVSVNYVSSVSTRGTLDILWSCLFTIIACTWTVQHLNVPLQREGRDPGILGDIKWALKRSLTSTIWMLVTVIAPEILIGKYYTDIRIARTDLKKLEEWAMADEVPWTLSHSLFANMGGFCLRMYVPERIGKRCDVGCQSLYKSQDRSLRASDQCPTRSADQDATARRAPLPNSDAVAEEEAIYPSNAVHPNVANPFHLDIHIIIRLRQSGALSRLPYLSIDELQDRSKCDSLVRLMAIGQILWMMMEIFARVVYRRLATSQLEIAVLAFACCAVVMYGLNWNKPKAVGVPITILSYPGKPPEIVVEMLQDRERDQVMLTDIIDKVQEVFGVPEKKRGAPISNGFVWQTSGSIKSVTDGVIDDNGLGLILGSLVFGGIHLSAWNFDFPTRIEQILWRSAALWCTCFSVVFLGWISLYHWLHEVARLDHALYDDTGSRVTGMVLGGLYGVARLYLLVETFRTLCFLPPDAYIGTWAANLPHIG